jgi:hypothetical protein
VKTILKLFILCGIEVTAFAKANYEFTCMAEGKKARVMACNRGSSAEAKNEWMKVTAMDGAWRDTKNDLMYVYASPGRCKEIGDVTFSRDVKTCMAVRKDAPAEEQPAMTLSCQISGPDVQIIVCNNTGSSSANNKWVNVTACSTTLGSQCKNKKELVYMYAPPRRCKVADKVTFSSMVPKTCFVSLAQ